MVLSWEVTNNLPEFTTGGSLYFPHRPSAARQSPGARRVEQRWAPECSRSRKGSAAGTGAAGRGQFVLSEPLWNLLFVCLTAGKKKALRPKTGTKGRPSAVPPTFAWTPCALIPVTAAPSASFPATAPGRTKRGDRSPVFSRWPDLSLRRFDAIFPFSAFTNLLYNILTGKLQEGN